MSQKKFTFSFNEDLIERIKEQAQKDFRSLSSEIEFILSKYLDSLEVL